MEKLFVMRTGKEDLTIRSDKTLKVSDLIYGDEKSCIHMLFLI